MDIYTVIFAALAIFICLRLRSVLGQPSERQYSAFLNRVSVIAVLLAVLLIVVGEVPAWVKAHHGVVITRFQDRNTNAPKTTISGPARVVDGDTVAVAGTTVRLKGVDAAELGTARGENARRAMVALVTGTLTCRLTGEKTYGREVGYCTTAEGTDINRAIIAQGAALACPRYDTRYLPFEQEAALAAQPRSFYCIER
ncbi:thermonuclease family protein [Bradyrhizobium sp. PMVTL-01]|uniref:thermonuclease family protein n=1 Tax=Bradyrhizobium sp. PMVTL-01 TaxID=3434999 RepID=UPI003F7017B6